MLSTYNLVKLNSLLEDFYKLTQIRITVFDENFHELAAFPEKIAPFCRIIRTDEKAWEECRKCDKRACSIAAKQKKSFTYRCHAGLTESIAPLFMGNLLIGYLLFGHVFSYDSYEKGWEKIEALCSAYHIDMDALKAACYSQPIISEDYISSATHILQAVAYYLCMERMVSLHQQELPVQIDQYLCEHFTEEISVSSICQEFQIGKTHLYEIISQNCGMGFAQYIRFLRIEHAKKLLTESPEIPLAEVASLCGFQDYNYFITVFKKVVGCPPRQYQKRQPTQL